MYLPSRDSVRLKIDDVCKILLQMQINSSCFKSYPRSLFFFFFFFLRAVLCHLSYYFLFFLAFVTSLSLTGSFLPILFVILSFNQNW